MRTAGRLSLILALLVWLGALGRLGWIFLTEPPPARAVTFVTPRGVLEEEQPPPCAGSAFALGQHVWQICRRSAGTALVRFDLERGLGEIFWPLGAGAKGARGPALSALARHRKGDLAVATTGGELLQVLQTGGMRRLGRARRVAGMAWVGDRLELVEGGDAGPVIRSHTRGEGWSTRAAPGVPPAETGQAVRLELAYRSGGRWNFLFVRVPRDARPGQAVKVDLLQGTERQAPMVVETVQLRGRFRLDGRGRAGILAAVVDPAPGGAVIPSEVLPALPLRRDRERWSPVALPLSHKRGRFWHFDYKAEPQGLRSIPRTASEPLAFFVRGLWLELAGERTVRLRKVGGRGGGSSDSSDSSDGSRHGGSGPALTRRQWLSPGIRVLPAADGGYWVLGANSRRYIKVDASLRRADTQLLWDRVTRALRHPPPPGADTIPDGLAPVRRLVLPVVVLLFPLLVLVLLLVGRSRRAGGRSRRFLLASLLYLLCSGGLGWWFWQLSAWF
jgi:hypothetical protein